VPVQVDAGFAFQGGMNLLADGVCVHVRPPLEN
jgi:hypothetical protein